MTQLLVLFFIASFANPPIHTSLPEAIKTNKVKVVSVHPAQHKEGQVLWLFLKNTGKSELKIAVPTGLQFLPQDSNDQTLILPAEMFCHLKAGTADSFPVKVYCCAASKRAPAKASRFSVGPLHHPEMIRLLEYCRSHQITTDQDIQQSIWSVSDHHRVESIGNDSLRLFTANLTGQKIQPLQLKYIHESIPGRIAFEPKGLDVAGTFKFYTEKNIRADLKLFDDNNELVTTLARNITGKAGQHTFRFHAFISRIQPGAYHIRLMHGNTAISEMPVAL